MLILCVFYFIGAQHKVNFIIVHEINTITDNKCYNNVQFLILVKIILTLNIIKLPEPFRVMICSFTS